MSEAPPPLPKPFQSWLIESVGARPFRGDDHATSRGYLARSLRELAKDYRDGHIEHRSPERICLDLAEKLERPVGPPDSSSLHYGQ